MAEEENATMTEQERNEVAERARLALANANARTNSRLFCDFWEEIGVGRRGFEPLTTCTPSKCATRLRYRPPMAKGLKNQMIW